MKLGPSETKTGRNVRKFECEKFSCFPEEKETLFFGGDTELRIKGIMQWAKGKWRHYDKYMEPINALNRMIKAKQLQDEAINNSGRAQKWMKCIIVDQIRRQLSETDKIQTPQYVFSLVSYQMSSKEHIRLHWNEMKSGYQWMNDIMKSDDDQLDIGNLSVLFADATSMTFVVSNGVDLEEEEWESVVNGLSNVLEMGLSMTIRFELSSEESRQNEMNMMAEGYLEMEESKWKCRRDRNVLIFNISDDSESGKQIDYFQQRANSMIKRLEQEDEDKLISADARRIVYQFGSARLEVLRPSKGYPDKQTAKRSVEGKLRLKYAHGYSGSYDDSLQNLYLSKVGTSPKKQNVTKLVVSVSW